MTDTDEFVLTEAARGAPAPPRRARWTESAATWVAASAALVLVGVLACAPAQPDLSDGIRWNVLAADLTTEPAITWWTDLAVDEVLGALGENVLVTTDHGVDTDDDQVGRTITAVDISTGEQRWHVADPARTCELSPRVLACVTNEGEPEATITLTGADGTVARTVPHPGALSAIDVDGGGLVVVEGGSGALADVVRIEGFGKERWRHTLSFSGEADWSWTDLEVDGDVAVVPRSGSWDLASGERVAWSEHETAHDGTARRVIDGTTLVTLPDGTELEVPAEEMRLAIDDAFGGPVSLRFAVNAGITATSDEGAVTYVTESDTRLCDPRVRLHGTLVQVCIETSGVSETELVAVDQLTGQPLWSRTGVGFRQQVAAMDTLIVSSGTGVEGIDPATGETRWAIPLIDGYPLLTAVDGVILVSTRGTLMRLG